MKLARSMDFVHLDRFALRHRAQVSQVGMNVCPLLLALCQDTCAELTGTG